MNWKRYKALSPKEKRDETYYIIGLDIGNESSALAFFNLHENTPEPIDLSGGYGKPSIPTVMQYITETKEWVFGEYAILNQGSGTEITLHSMVQRLGQNEYLDIDNKAVSLVSVLGLFIKEILSSIRNINPKAEIVGIVAAVQAYMDEAAHEELRRAFGLAGYEKELIALVPSRECILAHYCGGNFEEEEQVLVLDYGSREVRGGLYHMAVNSGAITAKAISSLFDESVGTEVIWQKVYSLFESHFRSVQKGTPQHDQLTAFAYQHRDILFQKNIRTKPAKLYYNFVYPPFQQAITHADAEGLIKPYRQQFTRFIRDMLAKNVYGTAIPTRDIDVVLCTGGGFEMLWAREAVADIFGNGRSRVFRNAKMVVAEGAAFIAAKLLDIVVSKSITVEDNHRLSVDIGLKAGDVFLPLVERDAFWWQVHQPKLILVNSLVSGDLQFAVAQRTKSGDMTELMLHNLIGLPSRPKGTTRLRFGINFISNSDITINVTDIGFGELFPKTDYEKEFAVGLK